MIYIVNKGGCVHQIEDQTEDQKALIATKMATGEFRAATDDDIAKWESEFLPGAPAKNKKAAAAGAPDNSGAQI